MKPYNRKQVFYAACMAMFIFGIMMTILGSILPSIFMKFGLNGSEAGYLFLFMTFGMFAGSLIFGPIVDRFGYKTLLIVCSGLIITGLEGIAYGSSIGFIRISLLLIGFGGGVINGGANALVADIAEAGKSADLSLLGVFFGLGAFGVPFVLGSLLDIVAYETIIAGIGGLVFVPLIFFILIPFPSPKLVQGLPVREGVNLLKNPLLVVLGLILFFESGMEITAGGWISSYFTREFGVATERATIILSLYWLGMMGARIVLNGLLKRLPPGRVLITSIAIAFSGTLLLILTNNTLSASAGVVLLGAGFAAAFPVVLGYVGDMYPDLSGTAFSIVLVMALTGGMILPYTVSVISDMYSLRASFGIVSASLLFQIVLFLVYSAWNRVRSSG